MLDGCGAPAVLVVDGPGVADPVLVPARFVVAEEDEHQRMLARTHGALCGRQRAAPFRLLHRPRNGVGERDRVLRARHREHAAKDEARHAVDAGLLGLFGLGRYPLDVAVAGEPFERERAVHAAVDRRLHQNLAVGEVGAFGEVKFHQPLLHLAGVAGAAGTACPQDQAMAIGRIGLP